MMFLFAFIIAFLVCTIIFIAEHEIRRVSEEHREGHGSKILREASSLGSKQLHKDPPAGAKLNESGGNQVDAGERKSINEKDSGVVAITSTLPKSIQSHHESKGRLTCHGKEVDSEIIYWKIVPGDNDFESPITPHHDEHHDKYLTFEYDQGGWNNVRMGMECLLVVAHATGRTLVIPPMQHLYLLGQKHQDSHDAKEHDEMGFEDFFELDLLRGHKGFNMISMKDFLNKEAMKGKLKGLYPPGRTADAWGTKLWAYLDKVADATPEWAGHFLALPDHPGDFIMSTNNSARHSARIIQRMLAFGGDRSPVFYDEKLQKAHLLHFPADHGHRLLQHHYAFTYFADKTMQGFYKRFIRDYMRYKDNIQCAGHDLLAAVRADARREDPRGNGTFYAVHSRRGDFQYKEVKISAHKMLENLRVPNSNGQGSVPLFPLGSLVYISTDDPEGVCRNCRSGGKPCEEYKNTVPRPPGCPADPSWDAFREAGYTVRFLSDYLRRGLLKDVNPNLYGMVESIVCSRSKVFAGTFHSTFTGYIHRLRGYHGIAEDSYYHTTGFLNHMRMKQSVGHGFSREWRAGWTDDAGHQI